MATNTIPRNPAEWTYDNAVAALALEKDAQTRNDSALLYLQGRGWQPDRWMGPGHNSAGVFEEATRSRVRRQHVGVPEAAKCVGRRVNAVCGNQAAIDIAPTEPAGEAQADGTKGLSNEQEAFRAQWLSDIGGWWDWKRFHGGTDIAHPSGVRGLVALASAYSSGTACIRIFFNPASRTLEVTAKDGSTSRQIPKAADRAEALRHIEFVTLPPDVCGVYTDPDTHQKTGIFLFKDLQDRSCAEVWFSTMRGKEPVTVLRNLVSGVQEAPDEVLPYGRGLLPIVQADIGCLLTDDVLSQQAAINAGATALVRLQEAHGYAQRDEINTSPAGTWRKEAPAEGTQDTFLTKEVDGTIWYLWEGSRELGNGVVTNLVGIEHTISVDPATQKETVGLTTPVVQYHEPSPPDAVIDSTDAFIMMLRDSCHQGHIRKGLKASTAEASGEAYEQSRAEFVSDITGVAESVDAALILAHQWLTVAADYIVSGSDSGFLDAWTVKVQSHPNAGTPSAESQRVAAEMVDKQLLSPEEGTARLGVQDVAAERAAVANAHTLAVESTRAATIAAYVAAGADFIAAAMRTGLSKEDATALAQSDGLPNVQQ